LRSAHASADRTCLHQRALPQVTATEIAQRAQPAVGVGMSAVLWAVNSPTGTARGGGWDVDRPLGGE
jgi:hypothetical protein